MIPAIVTLVVGLAIVIISFFIGDGKKEDETDGTLAESREKIEKQLDEYCDLLVEKKKNDLKKQGDEVKNNMKKGLDEVKNSSKKELAEIRESSKKEIDEYRENAKKEIEDFKVAADKSVNDMADGTKQKIDKAVADYESSITDAKDKMKAELEKCSSQLSEKAKKQMIDYINQSLTEAYESYDPEDKSEKEPITYEEESAETEGKKEDSDEAVVEEKAATQEENVQIEADTVEKTEDTQNDQANAESVEVSEQVSDKAAEEEHADSTADNVNSGDAQDTVVSIEESQVTDSAFTVVEAENPEKMAADIEEGNVVPAPQKNRNNRSRKRKKKKSAQNKPLDIWDEGVDTETQVAELHKKGLSIMEIANKLGIGVGEAKVMIDQMNEAKETKETGDQ